MYHKALVGAATRYIAGRNAVQTVYWRTSDTPNCKMLKVSKTFNFGSARNNGTPPIYVQGEKSIRFT
ncbi:hypothetical protein PPYR_15144 [Photinus pyralis]|uniref:Uncharacterized protein n=1 Tax=Photinus pyralis TaxID=7054 RepID=A0A5N3ZZF8_PHOPY|nr:hypothetical protein PPYR_15144 [Photinus pyralis]